MLRPTYRCPNLKMDGTDESQWPHNISVAAIASLTVLAEGVENHDDDTPYWDRDSVVTCLECGEIGTMGDIARLWQVGQVEGVWHSILPDDLSHKNRTHPTEGDALAYVENMRQADIQKEEEWDANH